MHTTSQEYLIWPPIGDSDFSFVIKTIVVSFKFKFKKLILLYFYFCVCNPR